MTETRKCRWGAHLLAQGGGSISLWAPGLDRLDVRLGDRDMPMSRHDDGWFRLDIAQLHDGMHYAFVLPDGSLMHDPASQLQERDLGGSSVVVDHSRFPWQETGWRGRPWEEAVIYELHVGTFTPQGSFAAAVERLGHLAALGVTAVELMPVAQFSGRRGWGYDGVLPYAPHPAYGAPDDLKRLVDAAHGHGLMILLDVVYNHFGPDGNHLARHAPDFFHPERHTPWGAAIAYDREPVRRFFIDNALYWLDAYRFDGLRLDAIDHIRNQASDADILVELAGEVRRSFGDRHIHLTTEDNRNIVSLHPYEDGRPTLHTAEWNDDFHNVAHVIATGESEGYYGDFTTHRFWKLARSLAEGFAYQGEPSDHGSAPRGEPSAHQPPQAFIDFLQNHDQTGNRAFGERLIDLAPEGMLRALTAILLMSPHIPLLFMGEEWGETRPFCFFTDFDGALADAVREGRRGEFADFGAFGHDAESLGHIPDPNDPATFEASRIDWTMCETDHGRAWLAFYGALLAARHRHVVPLLKSGGGRGSILSHDNGLIAIDWSFGAGLLQLRANLGTVPMAAAPVEGYPIYALREDKESAMLQPGDVLVGRTDHA